jgi:hypothetical protein
VSGTWIRETTEGSSPGVGGGGKGGRGWGGDEFAHPPPAHIHGTPASALNVKSFVEKPSEEEAKVLAAGFGVKG